MNEIKKNIYQIINKTFERSYFYDIGSDVTINNIQKQIEIFETKFPEIQIRILKQLKSRFPNAVFENYTHFFSHDRCVRILIKINDNLRFICQVSIFNFFSVYQHSAKLINNRYEYGELHFLNRNESDICDEIYNCANEFFKELIWLDRDILNEIISEFSILNPDVLYNYEIKIADALFTSHYL